MADDKELKYTIRVNTVGDEAIKKLNKDIAGLQVATKGFGAGLITAAGAGTAATKKLNVEVLKTQGLYAKMQAVGIAGITKLTAAKNTLISKAGQLATALERSQKGMSFGQQIFDAKEAVLALAGVTYGLQDAFRAYADFEQRLGEVNTLVNLSAGGIKALGDEIIGMSRAIPQTAAELTAAQYDILSAGVALEDSVRVLELSAQAAVAGVTETKTAVTAGLGVVNAYGKNINELSQVYDVLFQTVKIGVTTFPELAASIGQVLPAARGAGVEFEEVAAAIAEMTKAGIKTPIAMTALQGAINALVAPTESAKVEMEALGITWKGLIPTLEDIAKQGLSVDKLRMLIPDVDARTGVLSLTQNINKLKKTLAGMKDAAGSTKVAYDIMAETPANQVKILGNEITALKISMGGLIAEGLVPATAQLRDLAAILRELPPSTKAVLGVFALLSGGAFLWAAGLGKVIIAFGGLLMPLISATKLLSTFSSTIAATAIASTGAAVAMTALLALLSAAGIAVIGYAAYKFIEARNAAKELERVITELNIQAKELLKNFKDFKDAKLPTDLVGKTPEEVIRLRDELSKARAYWTALDIQIQTTARQTGLFGTLTDEAKKAQAELPAVTQKLREVEAALAALKQGQKEGTIAQTPLISIPDISEISKFIEDEKALLAYRVAAIESLAVEEREIAANTASEILSTKIESAEKISGLVSVGLDVAAAAYKEESEEYKKAMELATSAQTEFQALRMAALAAYQTALAKARASEESWANFVASLDKRIASLNTENYSSEERRAADRLKAEELIAKAKEEGAKADEDAQKKAQDMLEEAAQLYEDQTGAVEEIINGKKQIVETEEEANELMRQGLEDVKAAAEALAAANKETWETTAADAKAAFMQIDTVVSDLAAKLKAEMDRVFVKKELKVELLPSYEKLIEQFKKLTAPETKTITIQTIEAHAAGGVAGAFTRKHGKIPGDGHKDDVPALLMRGEYVIKKDAVKHFGQGFLDGINNMIYTPGVLPKFASGGYVNLPLDRKIERTTEKIRELQTRLMNIEAFEPTIPGRALAVMPQGLNIEKIDPQNPKQALETATRAASALSAFKVQTNAALAKGVTSALGVGSFDIAEILKTERDAISALIKDLYAAIKDIAKDLRRVMAEAAAEELDLKQRRDEELSNIKAELKEKVDEETFRQAEIKANMSEMERQNSEEYSRTGLSAEEVAEYFRGQSPPDSLEQMPSAERIPIEKEYTVREDADHVKYYYKWNMVGYITRLTGEESGYIPKGTRQGDKIKETKYGSFHHPGFPAVGAKELAASSNVVAAAKKTAAEESGVVKNEYANGMADVAAYRREGVEEARSQATEATGGYRAEVNLLSSEMANEAIIAKNELFQSIRAGEDELQDLIDEYEMARLAWIEQEKKLRAGSGRSQQETSTRYFATGGKVTGPEGRDRVPAMLTSGEYVLNKTAVNKIGSGFLDRLNNLALPDFSGGIRGYAEGGMVAGANQAGPPLGTLNIQVGENTMPVQVEKNIARQFIRELKLAGMTI